MATTTTSAAGTDEDVEARPGARPPATAARPTRAEVDRRILDTAAALFAVHGVDGTSLQQVADAVGYSKTGLLHRFASKQVLHAAAIAEAEAVLSAVLDEIAREGTSDVDVVRSVTRWAVQRPGLVDLVVSTLQMRVLPASAARLRVLALQVVDALTPGSDPRGRLRVVLALQLVVNAVVAQRGPLELALPPDELGDLVSELAVRVLADPPR